MTNKEFAPIPMTAYDEHSQAMQEALQSKGFFTREIRDGIYLLTEGWYHTLVIPTSEGTIVIDAPPSISPDFVTGGNLMNGVQEITDTPISHVIYTHHHYDHIGGAHVYPSDGVKVIAQEQTADLLKQANDPDRPVPTHTWKDEHSLTLGGQTLQFSYRGNIHCNGNSFIYLPDQKILMVIDVIFPGWVPFSSLAMCSDMRGFLRGHDEVLSYDFDHLVSGHLTRLGKREDVHIQKEYFNDLQVAGRKYLGERFGGETNFYQIGMEMGFENAWAVFDAYLNTVAQKTADEVTPKWIGKLAAVDVFTYSHAFEVIERMRVDA